MSSVRPFTALDLFKFNATNLDPLTENYDISFYLNYLARWPTYFCAMESASGRIMGYSTSPPPLFLTILTPAVMGKAEGSYTNWHGHVTALTVAPSYRRLGLAKTMMDELERVTDVLYRGYFVDLYVRVSNEIAIGMYERLGYSVYRRVKDYYSGSRPGEKDEDAFGE
jgi:N-terminal acetyltransferase B complex catalytic subunit